MLIIRKEKIQFKFVHLAWYLGIKMCVAQVDMCSASGSEFEIVK